LFFHKLSAFLDYFNHKQFFLFKAFASITSAPPLEKSWLRPWSHAARGLGIADLDQALVFSKNRTIGCR